MNVGVADDPDDRHGSSSRSDTSRARRRERGPLEGPVERPADRDPSLDAALDERLEAEARARADQAVSGNRPDAPRWSPQPSTTTSLARDEPTSGAPTWALPAVLMVAIVVALMVFWG